MRVHVGVDGFAPLLRDVRRGTYDVEDLVAEDYDRVEEILETYRDLGIEALELLPEL